MEEAPDILAESVSSKSDSSRRGLRATKELNALLQGEITEKRHARAATKLQQLRDVVAGGQALCQEAVKHMECVLVCLDRATRDLRNQAVALHQTVVGSTDKHANERVSRCVLELNTKANNLSDSFSLSYVVLCQATPWAGGAAAEAVVRGLTDDGWWRLAEAGAYDARTFARAAVHATRARLSEIRLSEVDRSASLFAQHTRNAILYENISHDDDRDFLSLHAVSTSLVASAMAVGSTVEPDSFVRAALAAGESELGQTILRDMVVSFSIPTSVLGVRATLLIPRSTSTKVVESYPEISQLAHETAMAGCVWVAENVDDDMRTTCAVLAGLACLLAGHDDLRSSQANPFGGLVTLPFLVGRPSSADDVNILFDASKNSWTVYQCVGGTITTRCSATGLSGLFVSVSCLLSDRAKR